MQRPVIAIQDYIRLSASPLGNFGLHVVSSMTGNANFPTPDVPLTQLTALSTDVNIKAQAAIHGSKSAYDALHLSEKNLIDALNKQLRYVNHLAYNDVTKINSSGFTSGASETTPATTLPAPEPTVKVLNEPGSVVIDSKPIAGAKTYTAIMWQEGDGTSVSLSGNQVLITPGGKPIHSITDTHHKQAISGLGSSIRYNFVMYATNAAGRGELSAVKSFTTQ